MEVVKKDKKDKKKGKNGKTIMKQEILSGASSRK
jgi:hypothetical protein